jgi:hypothetical protein
VDFFARENLGGNVDTAALVISIHVLFANSSLGGQDLRGQM